MKTSRLAALPAAVAPGLSAPCARFGIFVPPSFLRGAWANAADAGARGCALVRKEIVVPVSSALAQGFACSRRGLALPGCCPSTPAFVRSARPSGRKGR